jgi:hypothetical protein
MTPAVRRRILNRGCHNLNRWVALILSGRTLMGQRGLLSRAPRLLSVAHAPDPGVTRAR